MQEYNKPDTNDMTPAEALQLLKEGNFRFLNNLGTRKDLLGRVHETKDGQAPFAVVLSCMDSRAPVELIFDQGLGDIFSVRIAGNIITAGVLGSLEYATAVAGAKLILVMGHTNCGAIKGACDNVQLGNLTSLLAHIRPAVELEKTVKDDRNGNNPTFVHKVTKLNVHHSVEQMLAESPVIQRLMREGGIAVAAAVYDVANGKVQFMDEAADLIEAAAGAETGIFA